MERSSPIRVKKTLLSLPGRSNISSSLHPRQALRPDVREVTLPSEKEALRLVGLAYDAAERPELWQIFLQETARNLRSNVATFVLHDLTSLGGTVMASEGCSAEAQKLYTETWGAKNIYMQRGACRFPTGTLVHGGMLCTDDEVLKSEYYNEFLRHLDCFYVAGGPVAADESAVSLFSLQRPRRMGQYSERELSFIQMLVPHLQRAIRLHQHIHVAGAGLRALDSLTTGLIAVSATGKMMFANEAASRMLSQGDGLSLSRAGAVVAFGKSGKKLAELISQASVTSRGMGMHSGGVLAVERRSGRRPYFVLVTPIRSSAFSFSKEILGALVFVNDPEKRVRHSLGVLGDLFGMTPAECRVAWLLGDGKSLREIATLLNVSSNTLKSQVASIYRKTGTSRQGQLVHLLSTLPVSDRI